MHDISWFLLLPFYLAPYIKIYFMKLDFEEVVVCELFVAPTI